MIRNGNYFNISRNEELHLLNTSPEALQTPISVLPVDFSISTPQKHSSVAPLEETAKKICRILLKTILFPWGIYSLSRYITQRLVMMWICPAQSRLMKWLLPQFNPETLDQKRREQVKRLQQTGKVVRHMVFEAEGVRYSGFLVGTKKTLLNGKWALHAVDGTTTVEQCISNRANAFAAHDFNLLMINGPSVGLSQGEALPDTFRIAQNIGIQFLEHIGGHQIILSGDGFGGAALGLAIEQHTLPFSGKQQYCAIRKGTFSTLSGLAEETFGHTFLGPEKKWWVGALIKWAGVDLDATSASKLLHEKGHAEILIHTSSAEPTSQIDPAKKLTHIPRRKYPHVPIANISSQIADTERCPALASLGKCVAETYANSAKHYLLFKPGKSTRRRHKQVFAKAIEIASAELDPYYYPSVRKCPPTSQQDLDPSRRSAVRVDLDPLGTPMTSINPSTKKVRFAAPLQQKISTHQWKHEFNDARLTPSSQYSFRNLYNLIRRCVP